MFEDEALPAAETSLQRLVLRDWTAFDRVRETAAGSPVASALLGAQRVRADGNGSATTHCSAVL